MNKEFKYCSYCEMFVEFEQDKTTDLYYHSHCGVFV